MACYRSQAARRPVSGARARHETGNLRSEPDWRLCSKASRGRPGSASAGVAAARVPNVARALDVGAEPGEDCMRVLLVISGLGIGGAERPVVLLSPEPVQLGHQVSIYTLTTWAARANELAGSNVHLVLDQKRRRFDPAVIGRLRKHIRTWHPDLIHGFLYDGNLYSRLAAYGLD